MVVGRVHALGRGPAYAAVIAAAITAEIVSPWSHWSSRALFIGVSIALIELSMAVRRATVTGKRIAERLDLALVTGRMGVWEWNLDTNEVWWSDSLEKVHGLPAGAFGRTLDAFLGLVHDDDRARLDAALGQAVEHDRDFSIEFRFVQPDGTVRWMCTSGHVFPAEEERGRRIVATSRDITEQHEAAGALREVETRFEAVMTHAPFVVFAKDRQGRYLMVNGPWAQLAGRTEQEILGRTDVELFPAELARVASRFDTHVLATGEPRQYEDTFTYRDKTSSYLFIKFALRDTDGHPVAVCGIANDISARKLAEAALKDADKRKDEFLAILAHELRNPLAPVRLALEMMKTNPGDKAIGERAMDVMGRQLTHLVRLIDDLLDVSRITRGKLELRRGRVTFNEVIRTALETSKPQIDLAGHTIDVHVPDEPIVLHADLTRLAQVVSNLLNNAAKYTPRGGHIQLEVTRKDGQIAIAISDNGIGLAPEHVGHVFEMFAQVSPLTTRGHGGLGIGLALSRALVDMHGGRIEADSAGPGKGSTFTVHLPIAQETSAVATIPDVEATPPGRLRVLVADDNRDAIDTLALFLERSGHTVRTAADGVEAIEVAKAFHPDVAVLNIGMPHMDGYEVARKLRANGDDCVLIALTGWGQADDHRRSREAGFDYHLIKPVQPSTLVKLLATASRAA
ncbi:MAG: ATP-binding protein [Kofleriaceae bacterium]|nr:ATP-binding protein [Kofleriaceae bacterium]